MFQRHGMILKGRMKIRLTGVPRITGLSKKTYIRYPQGFNQLFLFNDAAIVGLVNKIGINKEEKKQYQAVYRDKNQIQG
jgi:hypothetical protein